MLEAICLAGTRRTGQAATISTATAGISALDAGIMTAAADVTTGGAGTISDGRNYRKDLA